MRVLVAGWFSFKSCRATAGDILAKDVVCAWLEQASCIYDVALAPPFEGGVDWRAADPNEYTHLIFVCGPFYNHRHTTNLLQRFSGRRLIGINLSMLEAVEVWNPFDLLLERDSSRTARPDLSFLSRRDRVPIVGLVLVHPQPEYRERQRHDVINAMIRRLLQERNVAVVPIDTCLDTNSTGLRTESQIESLFCRMDVVITTRLHGLVLAIKNDIPALAIDPIAKGAKISQQARTIDWPVVFTPDELSQRALEKAFDYCFTEEARHKAVRCHAYAIQHAAQVKGPFLAALSTKALVSEAAGVPSAPLPPPKWGVPAIAPKLRAALRRFPYAYALARKLKTQFRRAL